MKIMKNVMMMIGLLLLSAVGYAQRGSGDSTPEKRAERQTKIMAEKLDLSADQQKQFYTLQLAHTQKMQEMRGAQNQSRDSRQEMKSANNDFQKSIQEVLTDDQKPKYETMQAEMREGRRSGMKQDSTRTKGKGSRGPRE